MLQSVIDYYLYLPEALHLVKIPKLSGNDGSTYRMQSDYGSGTFQTIRFEDDMLLILIGDYTPKETFEKVCEISEEYIEIDQFETDSSSFKIGKRKINQVERRIYCYINTQKTTYTYCEGGKPVCFTKIILTKKYFDTFFHVHFDEGYEKSKTITDYLLKNPYLPELNFVFQQITGCQAVGKTLHLYLESKVIELLTLIVTGMEKEKRHIPVKLDYRDIRSLKKTVTMMKNDLAAYPTGEELAKVAGMSPARYLLVATIAEKVGYHNSGHFARLFKNTYGLGPREYRKIHDIK